MDTTIKDVTPVRLATWLAAQGPDTVVGLIGAACRCPLAEALKVLNNTDYASVGRWTHEIGVGYGQSVNRANMPWQKRFIRAIDALHGRVVQSPVTARDARDALLQALEGMRDRDRVYEIFWQASNTPWTS